MTLPPFGTHLLALSPVVADVDWISVVANLGIPSTILMALGLALWKILSWVGRELVIPLRDRLIVRISGFFDRVDTALDSVTEHMRQQTEAMYELKKATEKNQEAIMSVKYSFKCNFEGPCEYKHPQP